MMRNKYWAAALVLLLAGAAQVHADLLYQQPSNFPGGTVYSSQKSATFGLNSFVYDDFRLTTEATVTGLTWQGGFFNGGHAAISQFNIGIYADNAGQPGSLVFSATIAGNANETFVGNQFFGPIYNYSATLPTSFTAQENTRYWLSVQAQLNFPPQWGWHSGTGGNGLAFQDFPQPGARSARQDDMAFTVEGVAVPEPSSMALLGLGAVGLIGYVWRRRQKALSRR